MIRMVSSGGNEERIGPVAEKTTPVFRPARRAPVASRQTLVCEKAGVRQMPLLQRVGFETAPWYMPRGTQRPP